MNAHDVGEDGLRYGSAPERRAQLLRLVEDQGFCTIAELSGALTVSEMTIRRDVQRLVREGSVRSVHGGVSALSQTDLMGSQFSARAVLNAAEKRAIALAAAGLVPDNSAVGLDSGTTTLELARIWPSERKATVVTHSIPNLLALHDDEDTRVIVLGGELSLRSLTLSGPMTLRALEDLRLRVVFLAASSLNERGVYCGNDFDAVVKRAMIEHADHVVLLADSSKFDGSAMVRVCGFDPIDTVVIDAGITTQQEEIFRSAGVEVVTVNVESDDRELL